MLALVVGEISGRDERGLGSQGLEAMEHQQSTAATSRTDIEARPKAREGIGTRRPWLILGGRDHDDASFRLPVAVLPIVEHQLEVEVGGDARLRISVGRRRRCGGRMPSERMKPPGSWFLVLGSRTSERCCPCRTRR